MRDGAPPLELVLEDGTRIALVESVSIGRAPRNSVCFTDPSVSREHARIAVSGPEHEVVLEDAGSAFGTWLDGRRIDGPVVLRDGASIGIGDSRLTVQRSRATSEAGRTIVVRTGMSVLVPAAGSSELSSPAAGASRPAIRDGWALKRLEVAEGERRWILRDLHGAVVLRLGDPEAELVPVIDGRRSLTELITEAEQRSGSQGAAVLARLLVDLGEHGLLAGVQSSHAGEPRSGLGRLLAPRVFAFSAAPEILRRLYRRGGWTLFTRAGLGGLAAVASAGLVAVALVLAHGRAVPFVVHDSVGLGAGAFILGRLLVVIVHELAHGLTLVALGRGTGRCGVKFVLGFPYAFVDTTDALFEPRRRRIAISASGPLADLVSGGAFALTCLLAPSGTLREVSFQIALSAYTGALFNLNPLLDRDGYHILVDWLAIPNLRRHAREWLAAGGRRRDVPGPQAVAWYAVATTVWSALVAGCVAFLSLKYKDRLTELAPDGVVWILLAAFWALVLIPIGAALMRPVLSRARSRAGSPR